MRRQVLGGRSADGSDPTDGGDGGGDGPESDDRPRSAIDPRALQFREALAEIPDLANSDEPTAQGDGSEPPPTSTSQQVIDLDAIPVERRRPNTAEVDLAERLKSVPDGTHLPAVRTRLARPSGGRVAPDDAPVVKPAVAGPGLPGGPDVVEGPGPAEHDIDVSPSPQVRPAAGSRARRQRTATSAPPSAPWWRRAAFVAVLVALVAAVPILFVAGYRTITRSTDGQLVTSSPSSDDPGYEELVTSTPTAVLTQLDAEGTPIGHTLLSLSNNSDGGGSVVFIPLETELAQPAFGVSTLRTVVTMSSQPPAEVRDRVTPQIARLLNVGIDETFELDDAGWSQMIAPAGAIEIHNPDSVEVLGTTIEAGPARLEPDEVGGYLGALRWGENQLNQFVRHEEVWRSWLSRVAEGGDAVVPGESDSGLGMFIRTLAAGPVTYLTLPGEFGDDGLYRTDEAEIRDLVVEHVPVPDPAGPGSRFTVRLLNGVEPSEPSPELIRELVALNASISVVGNAPSFEAEATDIVYSDPEMETVAELVGVVLEIGGEAYFDPTNSDAADLTIIVGPDLHDPLGGP